VEKIEVKYRVATRTQPNLIRIIVFPLKVMLKILAQAETSGQSIYALVWMALWILRRLEYRCK
jgi:hypothetical protein